MNETQRALLKRNLQESIHQIQAVYASSVVLGPESRIEEIHVMASPARRAKHIVRDIESLLMVKFGIRVDYRKISLVQAEEEKILRMLGARPRLQHVTYKVADGEATATVFLEDEGTPFQGAASASAESAVPEALAAQATLRALMQLSGEGYQMSLQTAETVQIGGRRILIALVALAVPGGEELLIGTTFVRDLLEEAGARAALDAVNRRLTVIRTI